MGGLNFPLPTLSPLLDILAQLASNILNIPIKEELKPILFIHFFLPVFDASHGLFRCIMTQCVVLALQTAQRFPSMRVYLVIRSGLQLQLSILIVVFVNAAPVDLSHFQVFAEVA